MRLFDFKHDTSLAAALITAAGIVFHQPLRTMLDVVGEFEQQYHLDLVPALVVLSVVFTFQQFQKRQATQAAARESATAARLERERGDELEHLIAFGHSLGDALDFTALEQAVWRHLPRVVANASVALVVRQGAAWKVVIHDARLASTQSTESLEAMAASAAEQFEKAINASAPVDFIESNGYSCFAATANGSLVGVMLIQTEGGLLTTAQKQALRPGLAFMGLAIRNVGLLGEMRDESIRDGLTRWFNHAYAVDALNIELRRGVRTGSPLAILMFDLDGFKQINDVYGHLAGDAILAQVTKRLDGLLRVSDIKCRYGGDEFLVILPDTPEGGALHVAENVRRALANLIGPDNERAEVTASIGVAVPREREVDAAAVIGRADASLYRAKREGRNRVCADFPLPPRDVEDTPATTGAPGSRSTSLH